MPNSKLGLLNKVVPERPQISERLTLLSVECSQVFGKDPFRKKAPILILKSEEDLVSIRQVE